MPAASRPHGAIVAASLLACAGLVVVYHNTAPSARAIDPESAGAANGEFAPPRLGSSAVITDAGATPEAERENIQPNDGWASLVAPIGIAIMGILCILCVRMRFPDPEFRPQSITLSKGPLRLRAVRVPNVCVHTLDFYPPGSFPARAQRFARCQDCHELAGYRPHGLYYCQECNTLTCPRCLELRTRSAAALPVIG